MWYLYYIKDYDIYLPLYIDFLDLLQCNPQLHLPTASDPRQSLGCSLYKLQVFCAWPEMFWNISLHNNSNTDAPNTDGRL